MSRKTIYFIIGEKIGYWFASNRDMLVRSILQGALRRIPGGVWLSKFFR